MIYQLENKRTEILPLATSNKTHLCKQVNLVFAFLISMSRFKALIFIKIGIKLSYFCKNYKTFETWGFALRLPMASDGFSIFLATRLVVSVQYRICILLISQPFCMRFCNGVCEKKSTPFHH